MSHFDTVPLRPQNVPPTSVATMPRRMRLRRSLSFSPNAVVFSLMHPSSWPA